MTETDQLPNGVWMSQEEAIDVGEIADNIEVSVSDDIAVIPSTFPELEGEADRSAFATHHESPLFVPEGSPSAASEDVMEALNMDAVMRDGFAIIVSPVVNAWEYRRYEEPPQVFEIIEEYDDGGLVEYLVRFDDDSEEVVSL